MKTTEPDNRQSGMSEMPEQPVLASSKERPYLKPQEAAAQVIRAQIDNLYNAEGAKETTDNTQHLEDTNPYLRTHADRPSPQSAEWRKYHTAWQEYYQKYYESYYKHHVNLIKTQHEINTNPDVLTKSEKKAYFSSQTTQVDAGTQESTEEILFNLRQRLRAKVHETATKIKKSHHFTPIVSGIIVVVVLLFLQYNRVLVSNVMAYVSPGNIDPQNIIIDPEVELTVGPEPKLIIPKINVDVPVVYDVGNDYNSQMSAMEKGVAHFAIPGANSHPGEKGNTVIAGHSSNDLFDSGDYKFIFAQLDKLNKGDTIYANYKSKRYTYIVTKKEVVSPTDVNKLVYETNTPVLTLLTCTPLGTSINRLLVIAEQISPDPEKSTASRPINNQTSTKSIPGNTPSFFEKLFGISD